MPGTLSLYAFEDREGNEAGCYTTQDFDAARDHASRYHYRVIEHVYEWSEAIPVEGADYTDHNSED